MAYEREHLLLRFLGHFGTNATTFSDYWSSGIRLAVVGGTPPETGGLSSFLETISGAVSTFHGSVNTLAGTTCFLDELTVAHIGLDGKYASQFTETVRRPYGTPIPGSGSPTQPWSAAGVISLRTLKKRGLASNGRMYWPMIAPSILAATGTQPASTVQSRVNACKTMFDAINAAAQTASSGLRIHVVSKGSRIAGTDLFGEGWSALVTQIRADGRLDSIERRENATPPVWSTAAIA